MPRYKSNEEANIPDYKNIVNRIENARSLDHEESTEKLLKEIRKDVQPLIDSLDKLIGSSVFFIENLSESAYDEDSVKEVDRLGEGTVFISSTKLSDLYDLCVIRKRIKELKIEKAQEKARYVDTAVREMIPTDVYNFLQGT